MEETKGENSVQADTFSYRQTKVQGETCCSERRQRRDVCYKYMIQEKTEITRMISKLPQIQTCVAFKFRIIDLYLGGQDTGIPFELLVFIRIWIIVCKIPCDTETFSFDSKQSLAMSVGWLVHPSPPLWSRLKTFICPVLWLDNKLN